MAAARTGALRQMRGTIEQLFRGHGFIRAQTGEGYLFLPTALHPRGPTFSELHLGDRVRFVPHEPSSRARADLVRVLRSSEHA